MTLFGPEGRAVRERSARECDGHYPTITGIKAVKDLGGRLYRVRRKPARRAGREGGGLIWHCHQDGSKADNDERADETRQEEKLTDARDFH